MKKVLSFVLVLAMILGCTSMAFATVFKDQAEVTNTEAVAILNATGVLEGDDNGNMRPTATLTRAEACAIVARLMLGTDAAKKLTATVAPFADVAADNWAAGYIAYCASEGIVAGVGNNKFNPTGTLKVGEFGKMLLCVLGYDAKTEGLTGSDWANNTAKLMVAAGITVKQTNNDDCAREVAAQLALNALEATCVEYTTAGTSVTVGNTTINVGGSKASAVAALKVNNATVYDFTVDGGTTDAAAGATLELAEKLYPGKLYKSGIDLDAYGRDAVDWEYVTSTEVLKLGPFVSKTPVLTATTAIKGADLYTKLGAKAVLTGAASYVNYVGTSEPGFVCTTVTTVALNVADMKTNAQSLGGNGIITEIYKTSVANTYKVVQIVPTLVQVSNVVKTIATATEGAKTTYTLATGAGVKTAELVEYTSVVDKDHDVNTFVADCTLAKGDYVMVYGYDKAYVVKAATKVEGFLTGKTSRNTVTVDGTKYDASSAESGVAKAKMSAVYPDSKNKQIIVLDAYGYAVGSLTAKSDYLYVFATTQKDFLDSATSVVSKSDVIYAALTDGTFVEVKATCAAGLDKGLYKYSVNAKGVYELTNSAVAFDEVNQINQTGNLSTDPAVKVYANNETKYYVAQVDTTGKYTGVVEYTGYANMVKVAAGKVSPVACAFIDGTTDAGVATCVFVDYQVVSTKKANYVYFTGAYAVGDSATTYTYDVIVKGVADTMVLPAANKTAKGLKNLDDAGEAKDVTATNASCVLANGDAIYTADAYVNYASGLLYKSAGNSDAEYGYVSNVKADVPVYAFSAAGACTVMTAAELSHVHFDTLVLDVNTAGTAIEAIYVVLK